MGRLDTHVAASINGSPYESTGQSPHFIIYEVEKRFPYDLLSSPQKPVYNFDDYAKKQLRVFSDIHQKVQSRLRKSKADMNSQQHRRSSPVTTKAGFSVMVRIPERNSQLSPKFVGPCLVVKQINENKFDLFDSWLNTLEVVHNDRLKKTSVKPDLALVKSTKLGTATRLDSSNSQTNTTHSYNLRSRN
ncbi:hypothetical protein E2C01_047624 [Portunus trituberculatus]|uniref:Uncharacterized protein n=1 Tax=Portunus trituberculatus TaxID=210409 RepID=A0A5B7G8F1_PORTR|nr:hypothetical protein [Portunus trituberculatus]